MSARSPLIAASVAALSLLVSATSASAECKTMGFTVNDYGKDGPTKDAKDLLDKDIAKWAADSGVEKYTVGKKTVKCELFLDVILFDEHTCTASASVCWGPGVGPAAPAAPAKTAKEGAASKKPVTKAAETTEKAPVETGTISPEAPAAAASTEEAPPVAVTKPVEKPAEAATTAPAVTPAATESNAAERAAAAAERAAAAAERAAAAAEKAAASSNKSAAAEPAHDGRQISPENAAKP